MSLKDKSAKALGWSFIETMSTQGISFIVSIVLARLLEPAEFGLVGMAMVFTSLSSLFINMGFTTALVQTDNESSIARSTVFFFNIFMAGLLVIFFYYSAPYIARFYGEEQMTSIVRWYSLSIFIGSFSVVQSTLLTKYLKFKDLAVRRFLAVFVAAIVGLVMAFKGYGVYALVGQSVASSIVGVVVLWSVAEWRPRLEFSVKALKELAGFSTYVFFTQAIGQAIERSNALVIGKLFSPATLGFFTRAGSLNGLIFKYTSGSLNKVFLPVMSQLKHDKIRFLDVFLKTYHMIALLVFLIVGIFICSGELLIITLFGAKWQPSVIIFQVLILRAYGPPLNAIVIQAFLALGKSKANFWHGNVRKILNVASFGVAFAFGFTAYLYCLPFITLLVTAYSTIVVVKLLDTKLRIVIGEALKCVFAFLVALLPWYFLDIDNLWVRTAIGNLTFVLIYIAIVSTIGKENFQRAKNLIFSYVSRFVNRKRKTTSAVEKEVAEQIL